MSVMSEKLLYSFMKGTQYIILYVYVTYKLCKEGLTIVIYNVISWSNNQLVPELLLISLS
jgi:hypothetical protein